MEDPFAPEPEPTEKSAAIGQALALGLLHGPRRMWNFLPSLIGRGSARAAAKAVRGNGLLPWGATQYGIRGAGEHAAYGAGRLAWGLPVGIGISMAPFNAAAMHGAGVGAENFQKRLREDPGSVYDAALTATAGKTFGAMRGQSPWDKLKGAWKGELPGEAMPMSRDNLGLVPMPVSVGNLTKSLFSNPVLQRFDNPVVQAAAQQMDVRQNAADVALENKGITHSASLREKGGMEKSAVSPLTLLGPAAGWWTQNSNRVNMEAGMQGRINAWVDRAMRSGYAQSPWWQRMAAALGDMFDPGEPGKPGYVERKMREHMPSRDRFIAFSNSQMQNQDNLLKHTYASGANLSQGTANRYANLAMMRPDAETFTVPPPPKPPSTAGALT